MTKKQMVGWSFAAVVAAFMLSGPHQHAPQATAAPALSDVGSVKGGETYTEYSKRRDALDGFAGTYEGDGCTQDCSGHEAGYAWAQAHSIDDPDDCGGKSWSFEEGCRAYASEQQSDDDRSDDSDT